MTERRRVVRVDEQNVLRLQIGVGQSVVVQELDGVAHLVGHVAHVVERVRLVVVFALRTIQNIHMLVRIRYKILTISEYTYQEVEDAEAEHLEGDAHVTVIVEPIQHLNAETVRMKPNTQMCMLESLMVTPTNRFSEPILTGHNWGPLGQFSPKR